MLDASYFQGIKGAVYFPSRAYNAWQTWNELDEKEIDRDFGYAEEAGINALRMFTSYEFWQEEGETFFARFEKVVALSVKHGIRIMPILFEDCGADNTPENCRSKNPHTAVCVCSPCRAVWHDERRWSEVDVFVKEFMTRYGSDSRLLAIECMNEPNERNGNLGFARYVVKLARQCGGTVPLTIGAISMLYNLYFDSDLDVLQFHDNFPSDVERFKQMLAEMKMVQDMLKKPCWLTEWQRLRLKGPGWDQSEIDPADVLPALSTLADAVKESTLGSFFWSLMVKPAYLMAQRPNGTFNGLFQEDGSVYSLADWQAISEKTDAKPVTATLPPWYMEALRQN